MNNTIKKGLLSGEIKPEFGNPDHIAFLEEHGRYLKIFQLGAPITGSEFTTEIAVRIDFECPVCLALIEVNDTTTHFDYNYHQFEFVLEEDFKKKFDCRKCHQQFLLHNGIIKTL